MQVARRRGLRENAADSEVRGVCLHCEGEMGLEVLKNSCGGEGELELFEGDTCGFCEGKFFFWFFVLNLSEVMLEQSNHR